ncbi:MAG: hypothetical protein HFJ28_05335 [Clostridia bacterium]|jgi:hypothetical protein|nr:hypothetical protein [Clostridia bacterium]
MLNEKERREIQEMEKSGISVVAIDSQGKVEHATGSLEGGPYCDGCSVLRLLPDPDPTDWFRDGDLKAVCLEVNGVIAGALERPSEYTNILKPLYCPKLGRELMEE